MAFEIIYSPEAIDHLATLPRHHQVTVVDQIEDQLAHQPTLPTRKRKHLRPNTIAPWELRIGQLRVFYDVSEQVAIVTIKAVGIKRGNELWIGRERIDL